nr:hypothetical protein [Tanacetum cinerariifolium]
TIVATSTTKEEYVAAASCCGQVLLIQNQLLGYGDCFEKKLISVDHIHIDENVADLLTKAFDVGRFQYLVVSIGMYNLATVSSFSTALFPLSVQTFPTAGKTFHLCMRCAVTFKGLTIDARIRTAKTFDLVWIWLGGDYGNVFLNGF